MIGSDALVSRSARTRSLLLAAALLAALGALSLLAQAALAGVPLNGGPAPLTGSTFQGADGNQKTPLPGDGDYTAMPARTDWQTYAASPRLAKLPDGSGLADTWFFHGKEQEPDKWTFQQDTVSPGKADVLGAWSVADPVSSNVFLYLSFFRAAAGGTTFYNFELNQLTSTWTNSQGTVIPCRKNGDIIVSFELQGGAGDVGVQVWKWESTSPGPAACPEGKIGTWTPSGMLSTDAGGNTIAQGAMNTGPIANYLDFNLDGDNDASTNPSPASFDSADTFGEAALNLSKVLAGLNSGDSCFNFGQLQLHTRSSQPFTADLKDFIAPQPIVARSCAIEGTKYHDVNANGTQDTGEQGLSGFRIYADTDHDGAFDAGEPNTFTADGTQAGKPLGSWVLGNLPAGDYEIREDLTNASGNPRATEGWSCSDPSTADPAPASPATGCQFDVTLANGGVVGGLKFGNYKKALVRVEKQTVPDGAPGSFAFTSTIPGKASFSLSDGGVNATSVDPGTYTASETPHADFDLTGIACTAGGQATSSTTAQFVAKSGDTITCTFTNTRKTGKLEVVKQLEPEDDTGAFDLLIDGVAKATAVGDGGSTGEQTVNTGSHTVAEAAGNAQTSLSDYATALECKAGDGQGAVVPSAGGSVDVTEGADIVCTFTNKRKATMKVVKRVVNAAGVVDADKAFAFMPDDALFLEGAEVDTFELEDGEARGPKGTFAFGESFAVVETADADYTTASSCTGDTDGGTPSSGAGATVTFAPDPGEDLVCTFTNTRKTGTLEVRKELDGDGLFDLQIDGVTESGAAGVGDGGTTGPKLVATGSHDVNELGHGVDLADYVVSTSCKDDGEPIETSGSGKGAGNAVSVDVEAGHAVVCTIRNVERGSVTIVKQAVGGEQGDTFGFTPSDDLAGASTADPALDAGGFTLAGGGSQGFLRVAPDAGGAYTVTEDVPAGWRLTRIACDDGDSTDASDKAGVSEPTATIKVGAGEHVNCTFTNTRNATIKVTKVVEGGAEGDQFAFDASSRFGAGSTSIALGAGDTWSMGDGGTQTFSDAQPNDYDGGPAYTVAETDMPDGYRLTSIDCDNEAGTNDLASADGVTDAAAIVVAPGETVECTFTNTKDGTIEIEKQTDPDEADETAKEFSFTGSDALAAGSDLDQDPFQLIDDGVKSIGHVKPNDGGTAYEVTEATTIGYRLSAIDCGQDGDSSGSTEARKASIHVSPGETVRCTFVNTKLNASTLVLKEGTLQAHHGDPLTYTFDVTNAGNSPLHDVQVTDDHCSPVSATPAQKLNDDGDALLEFGEHWIFTCTYDAPAEHDAEEEDPIHNVATATALDEQDQPVSDQDDHETDLLHPDIEVDKTLRRGDSGDYVQGPIQVHVGDTIQYRFEVTNEGDTELVVQFSDPRCDGGSLTGPTGDSDADQKLDLDEMWVYKCSHLVTGESGDPVRNTVTVEGADPIGGPKGTVTDTDSAEADVLHPDIEVDKTLRRGDSGDFVQGPIQVHVGDTIQYRFEVTNEGDTELLVQFSDPRCDAGSLSGPTGDTDADGKLDVDETWDYRCSHKVTAGSGDPVENTVIVDGTDDLGGEDTDTDKEQADVLHPDIEVDKKVRRAGQEQYVDSGLTAHVGDKLEYQFLVTDGDSDAPIADVQLDDPRCDAGTVQGPVKSGGDEDALLEDGETWTYTCSHVITDADPNPLPNTATATGEDKLGGEVTDTDSTSVQILKPGTLVVKEGNVFAYPGDTVTFTFAVTNNGNTPLSDVTVTDDRCAPVTGPTQKLDGNQDALLDPGEKWIFACAKQIPADHKIGDENPIRNIATATGKDPLGKVVESRDDHNVQVLHPAIDIEKTGPATAKVGAALTYALTVTNPGDVPFAAQEVGVKDPKCEQPPAGPNTGSDATPGQLDPGDTWTYTCTAQTTGQPAGTFVNTATVTAKDFNGREVTDTDDFPTVLEAQAVLPEEIVPGTSRLSGPSGCVRKPFKATVRGKRIVRVTFFRDGKRIKTIKAKPGQRKFQVRIKPSRRPGVHRVTARVEFDTASGTRARTLRLSYQRCARQIVRPRFTG
jgi:hypothetical protein